MTKCSSCGTENPDGVQYCEGCGVDLTAVSAGAQVVTPPKPGVTDFTPSGEPITPPPSFGASGVSPVVEEPLLPAGGTAPEPIPAFDSVTSQGTITPEQPAAPSPAPEVTPDQATPAMPSLIPPASDGSAGPKASLYPKNVGAVASQGVVLEGARLSVGRFDPSTGPIDIDLTNVPGNEHVSRHHAELYVENGRWLVRDMGSTNGVYIRPAGGTSYGPRIMEPYALRDGDEIAFGNIKYVYREDGGAPSA